MGWEMIPDNIGPVISRTYHRFKKPIIITENGLADATDKYRLWWLAHTIDAIYKAMRSGARVEGYLHWSLLDNFEWSDGFWPRFGLVEVDYQTGQRTLRPSAKRFAKVIAQTRRR